MIQKVRLTLVAAICSLMLTGCGGQGSNGEDGAEFELKFPPNSLIYHVRNGRHVKRMGAYMVELDKDEQFDLNKQVPNFSQLMRIYKGSYYYYFSAIDSDGRWAIYRGLSLNANEATVLMEGEGVPPSYAVLGDESQLLYSLVTDESSGEYTSSLRVIDLASLRHKTVLESFEGMAFMVGSLQGGMFTIKIQNSKFETESVLLYDGIRLKDLQPGGYKPRQLKFSADGKYIYAVEGVRGAREVIRYDIAKGAWEVMTHLRKRIMSVIPSPDGEELGFLVQTDTDSQWSLYTMEANPMASVEFKGDRPGGGAAALIAWTGSASQSGIGIDLILDSD